MTSKYGDLSDQNVRDFAIIQGYLYDWLRKKPHIWRGNLGKRPIYTPDWVTPAELYDVFNIASQQGDATAARLMQSEMYLAMYRDLVQNQNRESAATYTEDVLGDLPPNEPPVVYTATITDGEVVEITENDRSLSEEILWDYFGKKDDMPKDIVDIPGLINQEREDAYWAGRAHQAEEHNRGASIQATDGSSIVVSATADEQPKLVYVEMKHGSDVVLSVSDIRALTFDGYDVWVFVKSDPIKSFQTAYTTFEEFAEKTGIKIGGLGSAD